MDEVTLENKTSFGETLQAIFLPTKGMNLISYRKGIQEVIDQSTRSLFEERYAGLGALIGPHFYRRNPAVIPAIADESLFPHIARVKAKGVSDPFSHGIARYAPWKADFTQTRITAKIEGRDTWNGVPLAKLEGQNFVMNFKAELLPSGLRIELSVVSDSDSVVGLHYYYALPTGKGIVNSNVQREYLSNRETKEIPKQWLTDSENTLSFNLDQEADYTFHPFPDKTKGEIVLDAKKYRLQIHYQAPSEENCWQLYHPKGASFVCIEPISARNPRSPNLSVSMIQVNLKIQDD